MSRLKEMQKATKTVELKLKLDLPSDMADQLSYILSKDDSFDLSKMFELIAKNAPIRPPVTF